MPRFSFVSKIDLNPVDTQGVDAGVVDYNSAAAVTPLYQLTKSDWWCESLVFWLSPTLLIFSSLSSPPYQRRANFFRSYTFLT